MDRLSQSNVIERSWAIAEETSKELESENVALSKPYINSNQQVAAALGKKPKLWAVGSGKGGVGKSLLSANLSVNFARKGFNVLAIDLDVGGSNLHTCLGINPPKIGLGDWACGRVSSLEDVAVDTDLPNLRIVSGANDSIKITSMMQDKTGDLLGELRQMNADHIFIDLGAGTYESTLDCFIGADQGIISILPEPTSVENAYRFIRAILYRKLLAVDLPSGIKEVVEAASDPKNILGIKTPHDLIAVVSRLDHNAADAIKDCLEHFNPSIVINQVRSQVDVDVGRAIAGVCRRFFGVEVGYPGYIDYDGAVWRAVRSRRPAILEFPRSVLANRIENLTNALLKDDEE